MFPFMVSLEAYQILCDDERFHRRNDRQTVQVIRPEEEEIIPFKTFPFDDAIVGNAVFERELY